MKKNEYLKNENIKNINKINNTSKINTTGKLNTGSLNGLNITNTMPIGLKKKKKKKKGNLEGDPFRGPIIGITVFFSLLFICLMGYFTVYAMTHEQELMDNSYNNRHAVFAARIKRGTIYAKDGEKLAYTNVNPDGEDERVYPFGNMFAHTVGFIGRGRSGVESSGNYYLLKSDIPELEKAQLEIVGEKSPGDDIYTTLDVYLQGVADRALGIYKGAIIATEPSTGKVLCMVSKPDFDPGLIKENWDEYLADDESGTLVNRVTQGLYPAGSTFKIVTALEYIREHGGYSDFSFTCNGSYTNGEDTIRCYHGANHGKMDMENAFARSCNSSFASMSASFDKSGYGQTLNGFFLNEKIDLPFVYNKSSAPVDENTSISDVIQTAIGQGMVQITPLHLNMITAAVANNGIMMRPYIMDRVVNANGNLVEKYPEKVLGEVMTSEEARILSGLMRNVVENGTATKLKGLSYTVAGKTGSAEFDSKGQESHAWFTGFAPADDPKIAITVIIEGAGTGGDYAVPTAKAVLDAFFR